MNKATFIFTVDSQNEAQVVVKSLKPEIIHKIPKTNVDVLCSDNTFSLVIKAKEVSSLRAACNSYLRWIHTIIKVHKIV